MKILGVIIGHDSSACLVEDGKVVKYVAEERFNRLKVGVNNAHRSVKYCMEGLKTSDIDRVAICSGIEGHNTVGKFFNVLLKKSKGERLPPIFDYSVFDFGNFTTIDHHLSHAASAYYTSGFERSLVVVLDGIGESTMQSVFDADGKDIKPLHVVTTDKEYSRDSVKSPMFESTPAKKFQSLGWFYGAVTAGLGWRVNCDEGKTMGLAPYGKVTKELYGLMLEKMYDVGAVSFYQTDGRVHYYFAVSDYYTRLAEKYGRENVAATAQAILEDKTIEYVKTWMGKTGHKKLCVAGGVFLNVKLNMRLREELGLEDFWPFPLAGDSGACIGAALYEYWRKESSPFVPERIQNLYWGPEYSNDEIKRVLDLAKLNYRPYDVGYVAGRLGENKTVGWFQGRMEGGPRALGGRSILMSPLRAENKDKINQEVKFREGFRPFCPSVTAEAHPRYFSGGGKFMIEACRVRLDPNAYHEPENFVPAVTHIDNTARPQIVEEVDNPKYHALIKKFGEVSGHPVLLNTSLNTMGEPICLTPQDAIRCFYSVGLDLLVIGDYMLEKGAQ